MNLDSFVKSNLNTATKNLKQWIQINSVDDSEHACQNKPFGEGVYLALQYIKNLAVKEGFEVDECEGYCTEIKLGNGEKLISIYAHCDVVPVSGEWKFPPFSGEIENGIMYGRGTSDDKGPAMAAFYALKYIKENFDLRDYQVRLVIGGNEEKGSRCLEHYFHVLHKPNPNYGFTPDGDFPLIYGEKGISNYKSEMNVDLYPLISFDSGVVINSVPDRAVAILMKDETFIETLNRLKIAHQVEYDEKTMKITAFGKAAHGSIPEQGINAGLKLLSAIASHYGNELLKIVCHSYENPFGKNMDLYFESELLHHSTYNVGLLSYKNKLLTLSVNFRYPENVEIEKVIISLNKKLPMKTTLLSESKCLLFNPDSDLVTTLLKAYQDASGDYQSKIMTIGGGTYAKECKNTIAFGSAFPGRHDNIHDANESIHLCDFEKSISIYATAIMYLSRL